MKLPINFNNWIEENRELLKPPVGNKCVYDGENFIVMVVGGPNERTDFHVNQTEEFFYQLEGDIFLRLMTESGIEEITIKAGEVYLLPAEVPHSPQRSANSVGMVIEYKRKAGMQDGLQWYCAKCNHKLYEEFFFLDNIETAFGAVFNRYFESEHTKCKKCNHQNGKVWNP